MKNQIFKIFISTTILFTSVLLTESCRENNPDPYTEEIRKWQLERTARIGSETGSLSLAGLFWLDEGENSFGTDSSNKIIFPPGNTEAKAGAIILKEEEIVLNAHKEANIKYKDSIVTRMLLTSDESGNAQPTILTTGSLTFYIIKRGNLYGVRLKDKNNPPLGDYKGLEFFTINTDFRIDAKYSVYDKPKIFEILSIIGTVTPETCYGALIFDIKGRSCRLDAIKNTKSGELYLMFTDETTGKETYGNGRQLITAPPDPENKVILDFNKAFNWPCAYTPYATCPIPPKQNHIPVRVEAGEKKYNSKYQK